MSADRQIDTIQLDKLRRYRNANWLVLAATPLFLLGLAFAPSGSITQSIFMVVTVFHFGFLIARLYLKPRDHRCPNCRHKLIPKPLRRLYIGDHVRLFFNSQTRCLSCGTDWASPMIDAHRHAA